MSQFNIEVAGPHYPGRRAISEIFSELHRQAEAYEDFVVPTTKMRMVREPTWGLALEFSVGGSTRRLPMSKRTYLQLAQWIGLPTNCRLYKRLRTGYDKVNKKQSDRFWDTWCELVNDHFTMIQSNRLVRTLKRQDDVWYVRAFLSDRYRIIPNDQLFLAVADKLEQLNVEFWDARLSEDAFYVYAVAPEISAQIRADRPFEGALRWAGDAGDAVNAALVLSNSETGQGGCQVCPAIVTKVTQSYMVRANRLSLRHVGGKHEMDMLLSPDTIRKMNSVVFDEVRDYCAGTFDPELFQDLVDSLQVATQDELDDPLAAAEAVRAVYNLGDQRKNDIVKWLMQSGDRSRYGLAKAVTQTAQEEPDAASAVELEQIGANLIESQTALSLARAFKAKATKLAVDAAVERLQPVS